MPIDVYNDHDQKSKNAIEAVKKGFPVLFTILRDNKQIDVKLKKITVGRK